MAIGLGSSSMDRVRRRRFGQNFLDDAMARAIAADLPILQNQAILEVGPGHGALTRHLLERTSSLTSVEIDDACLPILQQQFGSDPRFTLVHSDFLRFDTVAWCKTHPAAWVAGNLPYNVGTAIIAGLMPLFSRFQGFMGMVQLEVAKRLCAQPGTSDYGSLSVWIACHADRRILRIIGPEHFTPRPHVDSATVLLTPLAQPFPAPAGFFEFVQDCFSQKRKRLTNSLEKVIPKAKVRAVLDSLELSEHTRAEELSPAQFLQIFQALGPKDNTSSQ
jgi:16S rRNA (adenine1518-N6/adenine1519-N6)-dimethyltransferase